MTFSKYDVAELEVAGDDLVALFLRAEVRKPRLRTTDWTELVLDFFSARARKDVLVEARKPRQVDTRWRRDVARRKTKGEFGSFDLLHSTNPRYEHGPLDEYWTELIEKPFEVLLAVESEWGSETKRSANRQAVLSDATKLALIRAKAKVMVFGPVDAAHDAQLCRELEILRSSASDHAPWLLVRQPWSSTAAAPAWTVVSG